MLAAFEKPAAFGQNLELGEPILNSMKFILTTFLMNELKNLTEKRRLNARCSRETSHAFEAISPIIYSLFQN